jgi:dienelactone hydrolase
MRSLFGAVSAAVLLSFSASAHAATPSPIEAYAAPEAMADVQLSQDGQKIAYVAPKGDDYQFVIQRIGGPVLQTFAADHHRLGGVRFADPDHVLMVITGTEQLGGDTETYELSAVILYNLKTKTGTQIFPNESVQARGLPVAVAHKDGHTYGYFLGSPRNNREELGLYRTDLDTLQSVLEVRSTNHASGFAVGPDGEVVARTESFNHDQEWRVLKGAGDDKVLASGQSVWGFPEISAYGRSKDTIIVSRPEDGEFSPPREISLSTGKISDPLADGVEASVLPDRKTRLAIGVELGGYTEDAIFFDPALDAKWQSVKAAFPGEKVSLTSYSDDLTRWVVFTQGPHDSGRYFLVDTKQSKATELGAPYPQIKPDQVGAFQWFDYTARDGTKLKGVLTLPPGQTLETARNLPFVMMPHGGPGNGSYDTPHFDWWAQSMASRGYVVFQPDFRGSGGLGRSFERAGWGQWGRIMETDVSDAIPALAAKGLIDPKRGCIVGWSYGGYATLAGVTVQNGLYRCAVAGGAVSDLTGMMWWSRNRTENKLDPVVRYWKLAMGLKSENDPAGVAYSPARLAARADAPILIVHGRDDTTVPISQAETMVSALKAAGKPVEFLVLQGSYHYIGNPLASGRPEFLKALIAFLEKYNPSGSAPSSQVASTANSH